MSTLQERMLDEAAEILEIRERRKHRRHDLEPQGLGVCRFDGRSRHGDTFGQVVDMSSGGIRIRTRQANIRADQQIRVRVELPTYAGISPFIDVSTGEAKPRTDWTGWLSVCRVKQSGTEFEVAGKLVDMEELDRGMLGLYLSTQPLAA